jgi:hypothetical protein
MKGMTNTLRVLALPVLLFFCANPSQAGWLEDAVNDAVQGTGRRAIDEAADTGYEKAKEAGKESVEQKERKAGEDETDKTRKSSDAGELKIYPGAIYDAATTRFLKESMSIQGICYRTGGTIEKVVAFYQKEKGIKLVSKTDEGAMFQLNGGAAQGGVDVTIQRPWHHMETGKMMDDTLISIVNGQ